MTDTKINNQQFKNPQSTKYILVAEDDNFYANIYKVKLNKEGINVIVARDGEETLKYARQKKPDLILLDLIMPIKDGFEVLNSQQLFDPILHQKLNLFLTLHRKGLNYGFFVIPGLL